MALEIPLWCDTLLAVGAIFIISLNLLVIIIVVFKKRMRTYSNFFVCSLAISDLSMGAALMPHYMAKKVPYETNGYVVAVALYSNVSNITAVAFERYICIMRPLHYRYYMMKHFLKIIILVWIIPIFVSLLPLIWSTEVDTLTHKIYVAFLLIGCTFMPFVWIVFTYSRIFREITRQRANIRKVTVQLATNKNDIEKEASVARIFVAISSIFLISWMPTFYLTVTHKLFDRYDLIPEILYIISPIMIEISAGINPVLYSFYKRDFRQALSNLFRSVLCFSKRRAQEARFQVPTSKPPRELSVNNPCTNNGEDTRL